MHSMAAGNGAITEKAVAMVAATGNDRNVAIGNKSSNGVYQHHGERREEVSGKGEIGNNKRKRISHWPATDPTWSAPRE